MQATSYRAPNSGSDTTGPNAVPDRLSSPVRASRVGGDDRWFWERRAALTEKGRIVLRGDADRLELNGIDRWLGGTHLDGQDTWRWDESAGELRRGAA
jgi:hypothetical protein